MPLIPPEPRNVSICSPPCIGCHRQLVLATRLQFHPANQSPFEETPMPDDVIRHEDGRVELRDHSGIETSRLYSEDLAPVPVAKRNWTTYNYAALWISMAHCIPTYMLSSGLIGAGMNWWQALITILLGNTIVLVPILLNSHPGTKYGISYAVFCLKKQNKK